MNDTLSNGIKSTFLIVGLGNPGRQYERNRHNIGFMLLNHVAARLGTSFSRLESQALTAKIHYREAHMVLAKPQSYMNLSGRPVGALLRYYKIPLSNLLVVFDDVDLPFGTLRLRPFGGSSGQRGMASIIDHLGTQDFPRLRLGIGRPPGRMDAAAYVLRDFSPDELESLPEILDRGADAVLTYVTEGLDKAMTFYNSSPIA